MTNTAIDDGTADRLSPGGEDAPGSAVGPASGRVSSGVAPLDDRTGGLERGGLHLLSSPPVPARTALVLQFLEAGLQEDQRVALVTRSPPERVVAAGERFGLPVDAAWRAGRLRIVGFRGDYEVRLRRAASPEDVFVELASLLPSDATRLAFDPGAVLWEGRGEGSAASAFVDFVHDASATALATTTRELDGELSVSTELVTQAASGLFELEEEDGSLVRLTVRKLRAGRPERPDVTLALAEGRGLGPPDGSPARRASDHPGAGSDRLLRLAFDGSLDDELEDWLRETYRVTEASEALDLVSRLQSDDPYGAIVISLDRAHLEEGRRACSVCRRVRPSTPSVVVSTEPFRASDRADLLRAGADECMTGTVNVDELASRLDLARARGGVAQRRPSEGEGDGGAGPAEKPHPSVGAGTARGGAEERRGGGEAIVGSARDGRPSGPVGEDVFRVEVRRALAETESRVFTVVRFPREDPSEIMDELAGLVRTESGDFAGVLGGCPAVWLSGTAPSEAEGFLRRIRDAAGAGSLQSEVLGGVRDADRLRELLR